MKFKPENHVLVPRHSKLSDKESKDLLEMYNISRKQLPKILVNDVAIKNLNTKPGDIIKIERPSPTTNKTIFYRVVISG